MALTRVFGSVWNPEDNGVSVPLTAFGAVGDGSTNDTTAIQAAIDSTTYELDGRGLTYRIDTTVSKTLATSGWRKKIKNAVFDFSNNAILNDRMFEFSGTIGSSATPSAITAGDTTVTFSSTAAYAARDWLLFASSDKFAIAENVNHGEWNQVRAVDSGTVLSFERAFHLGYSTTPLVYKPTLIESIIFEDCHFIGSGDAYDQEVVRVTYAKHFYFIRCTSDRMAAYNCTSVSNVHFQAHQCDFGIGDDATGLAYGITVGSSHDSCLISNINGRGLRHLITFGGTSGVVWHPQVTGITGTACTDAVVDSHSGTAWLNVNGVTASFRANQSSSEGDGIVSQGAYATISNVVLSGVERTGVLIQPSTTASDDFAVVYNAVVHQQGTSTGSSAAGLGVNLGKGGGNMKYINLHGTVYSTQTSSKGVIIGANADHADGLIAEINVDVRSTTEGRCVETEAGTAYTITRLNVKGSYSRPNTTEEALYFAAPGASDIALITLDIDSIIGGSYGIRNVNSTNIPLIIGRVQNITGYGTASTTGNNIGTKFEFFRETATGTFTCDPEGQTLIDSSGGAVTATLGSGRYRGQEKLVLMTNASNSSTLSVTNHETSSPEVFTFAQTTDALRLQWTGTQWFTVVNSGAAT